MTDGEPETAVSASLQKIKSIKNQHKLLLFFIFYFIKSQTSDLFVNHFDGHFAYLKTLDFSFKASNTGPTQRKFLRLHCTHSSQSLLHMRHCGSSRLHVTCPSNHKTSQSATSSELAARRFSYPSLGTDCSCLLLYLGLLTSARSCISKLYLYLGVVVSRSIDVIVRCTLLLAVDIQTPH